MVQRVGGARKKTRSIFKKKPRNRGKFSFTNYFQTFKVGDKVLLKVEPSIHKGQYFRRFHGWSGIVTGKQGKCYLVQIKDGGKMKSVIVSSIHLRKQK